MGAEFILAFFLESLLGNARTLRRESIASLSLSPSSGSDGPLGATALVGVRAARVVFPFVHIRLRVDDETVLHLRENAPDPGRAPLDARCDPVARRKGRTRVPDTPMCALSLGEVSVRGERHARVCDEK